ncbi:MAG: hypothetical protein H6722_32845 [Sandaracinus sp.]|nr:hypothetical protein [Sandaracinus sp.]
MRTHARLGLLTCLLALVGCVDDNVSVFVSGNLAPSIDESTCSYDPTSTALQSQGTLDVAFAGTFELHPAIQSQLQQRGRSGRPEPNGIYITRAEVTLEGLDGLAIDFGGLPNPFSVPMSVYVPPASSPTSPGSATGTIVAIPADYTVSLPVAPGTTTTVVASVRLVGKTLGDIDIETGDWVYPIEVCNGCLLTCMPDPEVELVTCNPGQDLTFFDAAACGL